MIQNQQSFVEASVLLTSLVIAIIIGLTRATRTIDICDVQRRNKNIERGLASSILNCGRFPFLHLFNMMLLSTTLLYLELSLEGSPVLIAQVPLILFAVFLPFFEITEYDYILKEISIGDLNSINIHIFTVFIISLIIYSGYSRLVLIPIMLFAIPVVNTFFFTLKLFSEVDKLVGDEITQTTLTYWRREQQ